jgi:hypothetical protein
LARSIASRFETLPDFPTYEAPDDDILSKGNDVLVQEIEDGNTFVTDIRLAQQANLIQEIIQVAMSALLFQYIARDVFLSDVHWCTCGVCKAIS